MLNLCRRLSAPCSIKVITNYNALPALSKCVHISGFHNVRRKNTENVSMLFKPVSVQSNTEEDIGSELVGKLDKNDVLKILNKFTQKREIKTLCVENGLDGEFSLEFS